MLKISKMVKTLPAEACISHKVPVARPEEVVVPRPRKQGAGPWLPPPRSTARARGHEQGAAARTPPAAGWWPPPPPRRPAVGAAPGRHASQ